MDGHMPREDEIDGFLQTILVLRAQIAAFDQVLVDLALPAEHPTRQAAWDRVNAALQYAAQIGGHAIPANYAQMQFHLKQATQAQQDIRALAKQLSQGAPEKNTWR